MNTDIKNLNPLLWPDGSAARIHHPRLPITKSLPIKNQYTDALVDSLSKYAIDEVRAPEFKGCWREKAFELLDKNIPIDLELGTGNGLFFEHHLLSNPNRLLVGLEIKYKPLIQTIRRTLNAKVYTGRVVRWHVFNIDQIFGDAEVNDIHMFFPDPWVSPRKPKNRMVNRFTLAQFYKIQKPNSRFILKTDSEEFFDWACDEIKFSEYKMIYNTRNFWNENPTDGFKTQFESYFLKDNLPIYSLTLLKE
jgi:tRNA (guanine-N7-)-methyltransferase